MPGFQRLVHQGKQSIEFPVFLEWFLYACFLSNFQVCLKIILMRLGCEDIPMQTTVIIES